MDNLEAIPYNIGKQLLQAEFIFGSGAITKQIIDKIVILYTEAIQHNINNLQTAPAYSQRLYHKKALKYYQDRLRTFLAQQQVSQCLTRQHKNISTNERKRAISNISQNKIKRQVQRALQNNTQNSSYLIKRLNQRQITQKRLIRKQLQGQKQRISERIKQRTLKNSKIASFSVKQSETCDQI